MSGHLGSGRQAIHASGQVDLQVSVILATVFV